MATELYVADSHPRSALGLLTLLFFVGVLVCAPCQAFAVVSATASHDCCSDHRNHDDQGRSQSCETLCAAKSAKVLISAAKSVEPPLVVGPAAATGQDQNGGARIGFSIDPAITDSSPPLYVKHAALLI